MLSIYILGNSDVIGATIATDGNNPACKRNTDDQHQYPFNSKLSYIIHQKYSEILQDTHKYCQLCNVTKIKTNKFTTSCCIV